MRPGDLSSADQDLSQIDAFLPVGAASGDRYPAQAMKAIDK
jgi:hypothetical protein